MKIFGAGMAGLIAGHKLRRFDPTIYEYQDELPNNHKALLRFRSDIASVATNIPFEKVSVDKAIWSNDDGTLITDEMGVDLKMCNQYSQKVTGDIVRRSIRDLKSVTRYIAPEDYINQMSSGLNIEYGSPMTKEFLEQQKENPRTPVVSTIPMNMLMDMVDWPDKPEFKYRSIHSLVCEIERPNIDVYQTIYFPEPENPIYRASITGNILIIEFVEDPEESGAIQNFSLVQFIEFYFGITIPHDHTPAYEIKMQPYGKLLPIDEKSRREFILYMTDVYRVYSLGRFATWRQLLLDDIVNDLDVIETLIEYRDDYGRTMLSAGL